MRRASFARCLALSLLALTLACSKEPEKAGDLRAPLFTGKEAVRTVQLYLPSSQKAGFVAVPREIYATASMVNQAKQILQALLDGPKRDGSEPGVAACFARNAAYHEVYLDGKGLAVVDLDAATVAALPGGTSVEVAVLYSLVRSFVANLAGVTRVLVLVDGEAAESLLGHVDLLDPLTLADF